MSRNVYYYDPKVLDYAAFEAAAYKRLPEETVIHFHDIKIICEGSEHTVIKEEQK